jgi:hypothetical protein
MRQATQHDCLPSLVGNVDKGIEIVCVEEKYIFLLGRLEQPINAEQKSLVLARQAQRANQGRTPFISPL